VYLAVEHNMGAMGMDLSSGSYTQTTSMVFQVFETQSGKMRVANCKTNIPPLGDPIF